MGYMACFEQEAILAQNKPQTSEFFLPWRVSRSGVCGCSRNTRIIADFVKLSLTKLVVPTELRWADIGSWLGLDARMTLWSQCRHVRSVCVGHVPFSNQFAQHYARK